MFDPSKWIIRLYLIIMIVATIMMITGCGHHYYSSDDPKTDHGPVWEPTYVDGIGWCACYIDDTGTKHCRPTP